MKNFRFQLIAFIFVICSSVSIQAQSLKNIGKKLGQKAEAYVEKKAEESLKSTTATQTTAAQKSQTGGPFEDFQGMKYDYNRGTTLIFEDDFSGEVVGEMAQKWTSNGRGEVAEVSIAEGKWLRLFDGNTYKIKDLIRIPADFTVEFDVLTLSENDNKFALDFGFDYQKSVGKHYYLAYQNPLNVQASYWFNKFDFASKEVQPNKRSEVKANMSYFANDIMKVKIRVDGERMRTYINDYKVLDTEMADPMTKKYFYLALNSDDKTAEVYISNFRIDKI